MSELERTKYLRDLRRQMTLLFSLEELKVLAFDLSIDWDILPGEGKDIKVQSIIMHQARRGRLEDLLSLLREERPDGRWLPLPSSEQQIKDEADLVPDSVRAAALQDYLYLMTSKVVNKLWVPNPSFYYIEEIDEELNALAKAQTASTLLLLDKPRRAILLRFIADTHLQSALVIDSLDLSGLDLSNLDLSGISLRRVNLREALLAKTRMHNANLQEANLERADLSNAHLGKLEEPREERYIRSPSLPLFGQPEQPDLSEEKQVEVRMRSLMAYARWGEADLSRANLANCDLSGAYLNKCLMIGASLKFANLDRAQLKGADLAGADLTGALNWSVEQLSEVESLAGTTMPDRQALTNGGRDNLPSFEQWATLHLRKP